MRRALVSVSYSTDKRHIVLRTPAAITGANCAFERDAARALIADQLAMFRFLWPDAPPPDADQAPLLPYLKAQS